MVVVMIVVVWGVGFGRIVDYKVSKHLSGTATIIRGTGISFFLLFPFFSLEEEERKEGFTNWHHENGGSCFGLPYVSIQDFVFRAPSPIKCFFVMQQ